ncbi:MAG: AAA family ATPase [Oscillospiraceae bacterium]|nr:AAA family ATPase [Oscillospiraceae bacterium]
MEVIHIVLNLSLKNFFLFAGAGSGKTRSLVKALEFIAENYGDELSVCSQQVAVITYTKKYLILSKVLKSMCNYSNFLLTF